MRTVAFELSYPKARREAGLRVSWTPRAGIEPASVTMDSRLLYRVEVVGSVLSLAQRRPQDALGAMAEADETERSRSIRLVSALTDA